MNNTLTQAIEIMGGQSAFARALSEEVGREIKQPVVWAWINQSKRGVPAEYCPAIEKLTEGKIRREALRPDVYTDLMAAPLKHRNGIVKPSTRKNGRRA